MNAVCAVSSPTHHIHSATRTHQVSGYPTIKYFTAETDPKGDSYSGGRDLDSLKKFVAEKLERKCDPSDPTTCSEKEQKFITTMVRSSTLTVPLFLIFTCGRPHFVSMLKNLVEKS